MTRSEIDAFFAIVKTGNMTAAANSLFITQPALSRRIQALENELGYPLFIRGKGIRSNELTLQGEHFFPVAKKWLQLFQETEAINQLSYTEPFAISAIGSISSYLLSNVFHHFMEEHPEIPLSFYGCHSVEAYPYIAGEQGDFALISDPMFHPLVVTTPVFTEKMYYISPSPCPEHVHPSNLDPAQEIRLPWYPTFTSWHDYWFGPAAPSRVYLDQMHLLESFLSEDCWTIVPASVKKHLETRHTIYSAEIENGPADRIIYSLHRTGNKEALIQLFLDYFKMEVKDIPEIRFQE